MSLLTSLTDDQRNRLKAYEKLLLRFNRRLNLISRDSARVVMERHILHSLALSWKAFPAGSTVVDWGTGGGLPGIPLAIRFPEVTFHLVDSIAKKTRAVRAMIYELDLPNVTVWNARAEAWTGRAHYSVSRATAPLTDLWSWHRRVGKDGLNSPETWPNGLLALKGGDLTDEITAAREACPGIRIEQIGLSEVDPQLSFAGKRIVIVTEPR